MTTPRLEVSEDERREIEALVTKRSPRSFAVGYDLEGFVVSLPDEALAREIAQRWNVRVIIAAPYFSYGNE